MSLCVRDNQIPQLETIFFKGILNTKWAKLTLLPWTSAVYAVCLGSSHPMNLCILYHCHTSLEGFSAAKPFIPSALLPSSPAAFAKWRLTLILQRCLVNEFYVCLLLALCSLSPPLPMLV